MGGGENKSEDFLKNIKDEEVISRGGHGEMKGASNEADFGGWEWYICERTKELK